jgi:predicted methyltransferase
MIRHIGLLVLASLFGLPLDSDAQSGVNAILDDDSRPQEDRDRDASRRPGEVLEFFGIGVGDEVADLLSGSGYWTRILVPLVGAEGRVYAGNNPFYQGFFAEAFDEMLNEPGFANVVRIDAPVDELPLPADGSLDAAIMFQAYHDLVLGEEDRDEMNRRVFVALKSGGVYGIVDHAAAAGTGTSATESTHRIDKQFVINEVTAAGFELAADSNMLANPDDDHSMVVFNPEINGRTDRFVLRFEKP